MMNTNGRRLAKGLTALLTMLAGLSGAGLVLLVPATLFAMARPEIMANAHARGAADVPAALTAPGIAAGVLAIGVAFLALLAVVLVVLRRIMKSVGSGEPFALANVGRLRFIAATLAALLIGQIAIPFVFPQSLRDASHVHGGFDVGLFLAIMVVLVLAEVFREGARLHDDAAGTI